MTARLGRGVRIGEQTERRRRAGRADSGDEVSRRRRHYGASGALRPHALDGEPSGGIRCAPEGTGLVERFVEEWGRGRPTGVSGGGAAAMRPLMLTTMSP